MYASIHSTKIQMQWRMGLSTDIQQRKVVFNHLVLEGDSYEVGRMQGRMFGRNRECYPFLTSLPPGMTKPSRNEVKEAIEFFDNHYPGINDEIRGVADEICLPVNSISYYVFGYSRESHERSSLVKYSQFAVNPSASSNGHTYRLHL